MSLNEKYFAILKEELVPALGCTEPIAIAYASAKAAQVLGEEVLGVKVSCSGNIIKNVKGVVVPNTGGLRGVKAASIVGVIAGNPDLGLEVIANVSEEQIAKVKELAATDFCELECLYQEANLNIIVEVFGEHHRALVQIMHTHTNIVRIEKDGDVLFEKPVDAADFNSALIDRSCLNIKDIYEFALNCPLDEIRPLLEKGIDYNLKIAEEGLKNDYGAKVGKVILKLHENDIYDRCIAYAAAASDARMSGCKMAVMTTSGSGNQGITATLPVIIFAREKKLEHEKLLRALIFATLITIHIKTGIGRLSAYCGAVCAASGSFCGIAMLEGYGLDVINKMIINNLGTVSGMICDGAKESCASKISTALYSAYIGYKMAISDICFTPHSGIIQDEVEDTIDKVGELGRDGMRETDHVILKIMVDDH